MVLGQAAEIAGQVIQIRAAAAAAAAVHACPRVLRQTHGFRAKKRYTPAAFSLALALYHFQSLEFGAVPGHHKAWHLVLDALTADIRDMNDYGSCLPEGP